MFFLNYIVFILTSGRNVDIQIKAIYNYHKDKGGVLCFF